MNYSGDQYLNYPNEYGLTQWEHPRDYGGFSPDGDFLAAVKTRDSGLLSKVNWDVIAEALAELNKKFDAPENPDLESGDERYFYTFVANHWACGWVEYAMVRRDAPMQYQEVLNDFMAALADYPVLDDEAYSQARWEEAHSIWEHAGLRDRIEYCSQAGVSIFAARSEEAPEQVFDILIERVD